MPDLAPFRAVAYTGDAGPSADLLAPPYDVVEPEDARALRSRSPHNAIRLVLPEGGAPDCYELAARRLRRWLQDGVLRRDRRAGLYVYAQSFRRDGEEHTRIGVLGALRLSPFSRGEVLPHEETHRGPKEDRLALVRETGAQLSPVFLVARDPGGRLPGLAERGATGTPRLDGTTPDGIRHRLWRVADGALTDEIRSVVAGDPLLIADGHHRYETAMEFARGTPPHHPARRTLACVVSGEDPGLLCLPTHRSLSRLPEPDGTPAWANLLDPPFRVRELPDVASPGAAARAAAEAGPAGAMVALPGPDGPALLLRPRGAASGVLAPVAFDRSILREMYDVNPDRAVEAGLLGYHRDAGAAARRAGPRGAAFLLPSPDVDAVWETARDGGRLPPKSTYFWPKLPSGLLFRPLHD